MAKSALNEIVCKYLLDNGYTGMKCDNYPDHYDMYENTEGCSCDLGKLASCESLCRECYPIKEFLHDDDNYYPFEQLVFVKKKEEVK